MKINLFKKLFAIIAGIIFLPVTLSAATYNITQQGTYSYNYYNTEANDIWNINLGSLASNKCLKISYYCYYGGHIPPGYAELFYCKANGSVVSELLIDGYTGYYYYPFYTVEQNGKAIIKFVSYYLQYLSGGNFDFSITVSVDDRSYVATEQVFTKPMYFPNSLFIGETFVHMPQPYVLNVGGSSYFDGNVNIRASRDLNVGGNSYFDGNVNIGASRNLNVGGSSYFDGDVNIGASRDLIANGRIGVGKTPTQALSVNNGRIAVSQGTTSSVENYQGALMLTKANSGAQYINLARGTDTPWSIGMTYNTNNFAIGPAKTTDAQFTNPSLTIRADNGFVGIGTLAPNTRLHVEGSVYLPSNNSYWIGSYSDSGNRFRMHHNGSNAYIDYEPNLYLRAGSNTAVTFLQNGNVGIGTSSPQNKLEVNGTIRAKEVILEATGWADFIFSPDYRLPSLENVANHIKQHNRLPEIPSEAEVKENGFNMGEMQVKLLQKIEELTLYMIQQQEMIDKLNTKIEKLENK